MREFRNMKLVRKEQKSYAINIVVDFDRKKHLSDASIKRRKVIRDRCIGKEQAREEEEKQKKLAELEKKEQLRFVLNLIFCIVLFKSNSSLNFITILMFKC